ncbi:hypothetical protein BJ742DRAFT_813321 [Cladochytrium replicatum]|nr:hypothetical protein BJ742DRAFT_813321 [Cladochytrium replicatum]
MDTPESTYEEESLPDQGAIHRNGSHLQPINITLNQLRPITSSPDLSTEYPQQQFVLGTIQSPSIHVGPQALTPNFTPSRFTSRDPRYIITPPPYGLHTANASPLLSIYPLFDSLTLSAPPGPIPAPVFESPIPSECATLSNPFTSGITEINDAFLEFGLLGNEPRAPSEIIEQRVTEFVRFNTTGPIETPHKDLRIEPPTTEVETDRPPLTTLEQLPPTFVEDILAEYHSGSTISSSNDNERLVCISMGKLKSLIIASHNANQTPPQRASQTKTPSGVPKRRRPAKLFDCPQPNCNRSFTRRFNLEAHMETHNPNRKKVHACTVGSCKKLFFRLYDLNRHVAKSHGEEKGFFSEEMSTSVSAGSEGLGNLNLKMEMGEENEGSGSDWTGEYSH